MEQVNMWELMGEEMPEGVFMYLAAGGWKLDRTTGNTSDQPTEPIKTKLSDILEYNVDKKYQLSEKACKGILRRAEKRGKELPEVLKNALLSTANITEDMCFSKTAHPRNAEEGQGWEESETAHTLNTFSVGEIRAEELVVQTNEQKS